jgi:dephospho-CoA kinase
MIIGLTGGISTGKSTVSALLRERGYPIVDADRVAKQVVEPGSSAYNEIVKEFGADVLQEDGRIDRARLGQVIFSDPARRQQLNRITHPHILREMWWQVFQGFTSGNRIVVVDAPLLVETGLHQWMTRNVIVICPGELQLERLMKRNPELSVDEAKDRIKSQMSVKDKVKVMHLPIFIDNGGSEEETMRQVEEIFDDLIREWPQYIAGRLALACVVPLAILLGWTFYKSP